MDKKLKESGLGRSETDKIRELIGSPKTEGEITKTIKIFSEAYGSSRSKSVFVTSMEKNAGTKVEGKFNFGACIKK